MTIVSYVMLAFALLATILFVPISATIRPLSGPDAMELAGLFFLSMARALALALALSVAAVHGGFAWIHPNRGVQWLAVMAALIAVAGMELWSVTAATSWYGTAARPSVAAFAVVAPLLLLLLALSALDRGRSVPVSAASLRWAAGALVLLLMAGGLDLGFKNRAVTLERRVYAAAQAAEERRVHEEKLSAVRALGPASPLRSWLPYTADSDDEIREAVLDSIRARPKLNQELAEILRSEDPLPALRWLWLWSQDRPEALAHALHDAAAGLPAWAGRRLDDENSMNDPEVGTACEALVVLVDEFEGFGLDFRKPLEALAAFLDSRALPEEQMSYDRTYQARSMLRYWFDAHASDAPPAAPAR